MAARRARTAGRRAAAAFACSTSAASASCRELAARGTIAATADALGYTAPAVSQQLAALEREAGVALLEKNGRGRRLTPAGEELVDRTESILRELEAAEAALARTTTHVAGVLRCAAFASAHRVLLPRAIAHRAARRPTERGASRRPPAGVGGTGRHARARGRAVDRRQRGLVLPPRRGALDARRRLRAADRARDERFRRLDALVAAGAGVGLVPELAGAPPPGVVLRPVAGAPPTRRIYVAVRAGSAERPAVAAMLAALTAR